MTERDEDVRTANIRKMGQAFAQLEDLAGQMEHDGKTGDVSVTLPFKQGRIRYVRVQTNETMI